MAEGGTENLDCWPPGASTKLSRCLSRPRYWPALAFVPLLLSGQFKGAGMDSVVGIDSTLLSMALLFSVAVGIVGRGRLGGGPRALWPFWFLVLAAGFGLLHASVSSYADLKARAFFLISVPAVAILSLVIQDARAMHGYVRAWIIAGVVVSIAVLVTPNDVALYGRESLGTGTLGVANLAGAALLLTVLEAAEGTIRVRWAIPLLVLLSVSMVAVGSRGPVLATGSALLVGLLLRKRWLHSAIALTVVVGTLWLAYAVAPEVSRERLLLLNDPTRSALRQLALETWVESPMFGVGWGGFPTSISNALVYPHNLPLEVASELGLVGLAALALLIGAAASRAWSARSVPVGRAISMLGFYALVVQQFSGDLSSRLFWLAFAPSLLLPIAIGSSRYLHVARYRGPSPTE